VGDVHITMPDGYDVNNIGLTSIYLIKINNDQVVNFSIDPTFSDVGDWDEDLVPDLTVRFDLQALIELLAPGDKTLTIKGNLTTGELFLGSDTIRVIEARRMPFRVKAPSKSA